jgi:hypothetical protein
MTFLDFLEHCAAQIEPFNERVKQFNLPKVEPLSESHVFFLGEDEKVAETLLELREDLSEEMAEGVPMPFDDIACVSRVHGTWTCDRVIKAVDLPFELSSVKQESQEGLRKKIAPQRFWVIRQQEPVAHMLAIWPLVFCGIITGKPEMRVCMPTEWFTGIKPYLTKPMAEVATRLMDDDSGEILWDIALISHPGNYVVKVTPSLTQREERRISNGSPRPIRKTPHFIVVDHEVLVDMTRKTPTGTHASPIPHHRRGHWKRLADRCRHARLLGKEKVFVRPTYVGERTFSDEKNLYEVLLNFNEREPEVSAHESIQR